MDKNKHVFDSSSLLFFALRWWKHLLIIGLVAAIASAIFSGPRFITPKFQSTVTMFPTAASSLSRTVLARDNVSARDFLEYGEVEDAERLLQVLESYNIRDRVIERFDLLDHYEIPEDAQYKMTRLTEEYRSNINFRRTQYGAVEIRVRDKDPAMAADIANEIAALADTVQNDIRQERAQLAYTVAKQQLEDLQERVEEAGQSLYDIMADGVFFIEGQSEMVYRPLAKDLSSGNTEGIERLEENLEKLAQKGSDFEYYSRYLQGLPNQVIAAQNRYNVAKADMESFIPFKLMLDTAFEAERKVYPIRWLIVFISTFAAGFMGVMIIMFYENLQSKGIIKPKQKNPSKS